MDRNTSFCRKFDWQPLKIQKGQFHTYCINIYWIIHQNENGYIVQIIRLKTVYQAFKRALLFLFFLLFPKF